MLTVSPEVIHNELETAVKVLQKWQEQLGRIPGVTVPAGDPQAFNLFLMQLIGELRVVSGKCDVLADTLAAGQS